jgi:epoxyqueuosine reductase
MQSPNDSIDYATLTHKIKQWGKELGFQQLGIADIDLSENEPRLQAWLEQGLHGEMGYMAEHGTKRSRPQELVPGTLRIISARMAYLPEATDDSLALLKRPDHAYIARYALGRDYHKLMRNRLQQLARQIMQEVGEFGYRAFVDSAPVMEKPLATKAGIGWRGKHSLMLNRNSSSWFLLGELFTDLPLPVDQPIGNHCGTCEACLPACPTQAIIAPYRVDARRCISYLTIELKGSIPEELRHLMGNRIYGCDDCQLACPWNRFAQVTDEQDFLPRQGLAASELMELFAWTEEEFLTRLEGSPIRRIGHERWLRNIAVALGNAPTSMEVITALQSRVDHASELVQEHVVWALNRHLAY